MKKIATIVAAVVSAATLAFAPLTAFAATGQGGTDMLVLNPGGGMLTGGTDGIQIRFNSHTDPEVGSDQIYFDGDAQWCCSGGGPVLAVGATAFGETGAASDQTLTSWDSIVISGTTGAFERVAGTDAITSSTTGNAAATITYTIATGGRTYTVARAISYTYPNNYFDEVWTVTIPAGNTQVVKLYVGGDVSPGGDDNGAGVAIVENGLRTIYEANPDSGQYISYEELDAANPFTKYFVGDYDEPYEPIASGQDLNNQTITVDHDAGLQAQWTLGSAAGAISRTMRTTIGYNTDIPAAPLDLDLALDASVGEIVPGTDVYLQGGGLQPDSPMELVMRSTPVVIDLQGATANSFGNFGFNVTLPDPIEPGVHSLTLTGVKPDGSPISDVLYFEIGADGKLLWSNMSEMLADTGVDNAQIASLGGLAALAMLAGAGVVVARRRKA